MMIFYNNFSIELEILSKYLCRTAVVVIPEEDTLLCGILEGLATMSYVIVNGCVSRQMLFRPLRAWIIRSIDKLCPLARTLASGLLLCMV